MIYLYTLTEQTVQSLAPLSLTTVGLSYGRSVTQSTETTIQLNCPGFYQVTYNGTVAGDGTVQLYLNGEPVPGATGSGATQTFTTIVRANPNCCSVPDNLPARL